MALISYIFDIIIFFKKTWNKFSYGINGPAVIEVTDEWGEASLAFSFKTDDQYNIKLTLVAVTYSMIILFVCLFVFYPSLVCLEFLGNVKPKRNNFMFALKCLMLMMSVIQHLW